MQYFCFIGSYLIVGVGNISVISVYTPQSGLDDGQRDISYDSLISVATTFEDVEVVVISADLNWHVGVRVGDFSSSVKEFKESSGVYVSVGGYSEVSKGSLLEVTDRNCEWRKVPARHSETCWWRNLIEW